MARYGNLYRLMQYYNSDPNVFRLRDLDGLLPIHYATDQRVRDFIRQHGGADDDEITEEMESEDLSWEDYY